MSSDLRRCRKLEADLAFNDFAQRGVLRRKFFQRFDKRAIAALELLHAARHDIDQYIWIIDDRQRCSDIFVSHDGNQRLPALCLRVNARVNRQEAR